MSARVGLIASLRPTIAVLLLCAFAALATNAESAGVAMVTDMQGKATATTHGRSTDVAILDELQPGTIVQLSQDATLAVLYLDAGDEYVFKGAATIEFKAAQPEMQSGAKPERRNLTSKGGKDIRIKPVGMVQGAMVMRGAKDTRIEPLNLQRTRVLESKPEFRWKELQPGLQYTFELVDDSGRSLFEAPVTAPSMKLPANVQLREGVPYTWKVSARMADGRTYTSSAEFSVASADLRAKATALRPAASGALSARIAYAAWLDQMELKDEARTYWKAAAAERPESTRLSTLAAQ